MAIVRAESMARPYSDDLRRKLLEAYDEGQGSLAELSEPFGVSVSWAWKISAMRKELCRLITEAGRIPVERDTLYHAVTRTEDSFTVAV